MTRADLRRKRYAELRAAGYSPADARRLRDSGKQQYQVVIAARKKPPTPSQKRASEQYHKLKAKGFTTQEANNLKGLPAKKFNRLMVILQYNFATTAINRKLDEYNFTDKQKKAVITPFLPHDKSLTRFDKRTKWGLFVKNERFPKDVMYNVKKANRLYGLNDDDGYGFGLAFYMWIDDLSFWEAIQIYQPDETNPDRYIFANVMPS